MQMNVMKNIFVIIYLLVSLVSCREDESFYHNRTLSLADALYEYEDSLHTERIYFSDVKEEFTYEYLLPIEGSFGYAGVPYKFIFPYIFFDQKYSSQMDIKKIKIINDLEIEITRLSGNILVFKRIDWQDNYLENTFLPKHKK